MQLPRINKLGRGQAPITNPPPANLSAPPPDPQHSSTRTNHDLQNYSLIVVFKTAGARLVRGCLGSCICRLPPSQLVRFWRGPCNLLLTLPNLLFLVWNQSHATSLKREPLAQPTNQHFKITCLHNGLVIRSNKREIFWTQCEGKCATLSRL